MNFNAGQIFMLVRLGMRFFRMFGGKLRLPSFGRGRGGSKPASGTPVKQALKPETAAIDPKVQKFWQAYKRDEISIVERFLDDAERDENLDDLLETIHPDVFYDLVGPEFDGTYILNLLVDGDAAALKAARGIARAAPQLQMTTVSFKKV